MRRTRFDGFPPAWVQLLWYRLARALAVVALAAAFVLAGSATSFAGSREATSTSLSSSVNPSLLGHEVTLVATVQADFYSGTVPSGSVTFSEGSTTLGTASVGVVLEGSSAVIEATLKTDTLPQGENSIVATYSGDGSYQGSVSAPFSQDVQEPTSLVLTASPSTSLEGSTVRLTATVTGSSGSALPSGSGLVAFSFGSEPLAQLDLVSESVDGATVSQASTTVASLPVGSDTITATYLGSNGYAGSTGSTLELVNAPAVPSAPQNPTAKAIEGGVMLGWGPPANDGGSPIEAYSVFEGTAPGAESSTPVNPEPLSPTTTSYTVSGLTPGTVYYFTVVAFSGVGPSAPSAEVSATPLSPTTTPEPPRDVTAVAGDNGVTLSWGPPANDGGSPIEAYSVFEGTAPGAESSTPVNPEPLSPTTTSYTVSGLTPGTAYYFTVVARNSVGSSSASAEVSATITATEVTAPSNQTPPPPTSPARTQTSNPEPVTLPTGPPEPPAGHTALLLPGILLMVLGGTGLLATWSRRRGRSGA